MKKFVLALCFMLSIGGFCFAESRNVDVLLNKRVQVTYDGEIQEFQNVSGERVYPLTYEGTTYLPIRSISTLFGTEIKWDGEKNSVYLGSGEYDENSAKVVEKFISGESEDISALLNEDIKIYYNDEVQIFEDANEKTVYPLSYNGTTYLPVRAVSDLFGLDIEWDEEAYSVDIYEIYTDPSFIDENGTEIFYYSDEDDGTTYYYFWDDEETLRFYYYDENDELVSYFYDTETDDLIFYYYDDQDAIHYYFFDDDGKKVETDEKGNRLDGVKIERDEDIIENVSGDSDKTENEIDN